MSQRGVFGLSHGCSLEEVGYEGVGNSILTAALGVGDARTVRQKWYVYSPVK